MSLQFNVSQLLKGGVGETRSYDFVTEAPLNLEGSVAREVEGRAKFTLTNFGILADIRAHGELDLQCARCLESFRTPADVSFQEEYEPSIDIGTGLPTSAPRLDNAFAISSTHTIDLGEALRQHFLLAVEMVPLCSEDCQGLCAQCGANFNTETCQCAPVEESSPFAALGALLQDADTVKETT